MLQYIIKQERKMTVGCNTSLRVLRALSSLWYCWVLLICSITPKYKCFFDIKNLRIHWSIWIIVINWADVIKWNSYWLQFNVFLGTRVMRLWMKDGTYGRRGGKEPEPVLSFLGIPFSDVERCASLFCLIQCAKLRVLPIPRFQGVPAETLLCRPVSTWSLGLL